MSPETGDRLESGTSRLLRTALRRARQALLWERLWPMVTATAAAVALFLIVSWAGLWTALPPFGRIAGLVVFALLVVASFVPFSRLRMPDANEALNRLDHSSGLQHRPATAIADPLATRTRDPVSDVLWREHLRRAAESARKLRAGTPRPRLALRDPLALRALILLGLVTTFFMAEGERQARIAAAFDWRGVVTSQLYRVDAWVTPPPYTGRAPVLLPGIRHDAPAPGETAAISVPAGSELLVRATGLVEINLAIDGGIAEAVGDAPNSVANDGSIEHRLKITESGTVSIRDLPAGFVNWGFRAVPDNPPVIAHAREPQVIGRASLSFTYRIEDDYGVVSAEARFASPEIARRGSGPEPRPLVAAPEFNLTLPQARTRAGTGQTTRDLMEHPWAGVTASVTLIARDEGGNEGTSDTREIRLPERPFSKPLARALIEQRRILAFDANARGHVGQMLDALMIAPEKFTPEPAIYLGLRTAATRLKLARNDDDLRAVVDYLWEIAVLIEDGSMSDAERDLRAAQDALRQALERGASDEEIRKLTEELRQALDRFMRALAEQLQRDGTTDARPLDRNTQVMRPQDLQNMIDRIEQLARSGARDAARRMLDEMQAMLDNLSRDRMARGNPNSDDMNSMLDELGRMIQEQQRLRDRTFREGRNERGQQRAFDELRGNQEGLRQQLERMLEQLRRQQQGMGQEGQQGQGEGDETGDALGRAGQAMRDAEGSLGEGNAEGAVEGQGRALQNLRRGAQSMAESMQGGPGQGPGEPGGPQAGSAERTDPLGRPVRSREYGDDSTVRVPDEIDVQRARRVLEELRRRLGESERPRLELDYIERLLRDF